MKIKSMRWGYDGGGIACGPIPGSCNVEVIFENGDKDLMITSSQIEDFENIWVTERPIFDKLIEQDFDEDELSEIAIEEYGMEIDPDHIEDEFENSEYLNEIRFVRFCMQGYIDYDGFPGQAEADAFIADYVGKDAADYEFPPFTYGFGRNYDEEDDEEDE